MPNVSVREFPRLDLHYEAETPSGRFYRWAKDEVRPENVPTGAGFTTTDHGGFDSQNLTLPRKPGVDYADLERLTTIRALGAGGEVACETRLKEAPRTSGDQIAVTPVAEGWIAHLEDDQTASEIYVDRDTSSWQEPSRAKQEGVAAIAQYGSWSAVVDAATGRPGLVGQVNEVPFTHALIEAWYDAGVGHTISAIDITSKLLAFGLPDASLNVEVSTAADDIGTSLAGTDLKAFNGTHTRVTSLTARQYVVLSLFWSGTSGGAPGATYGVNWSELAVWGSSGLTIQGTGPGAGFYTSDIIAHFLAHWAPLLNFSTGSTGTVRPGSFVVPHLSFKDQTTPLAMLEAVNKFELRPYMVWEDRTFHWQEWGEGRKWRARVAPTQLSETGPSTSRLRNGVLLRWNEVDGTSRSAGPIGSGCDIESAELEDRDPENPANQLGIPFWGTPPDLGIVTVDSEAIRIGVLLQARLKEVDRSGQAQIVGVCEDDKGIVRPAWQVRAGDTITFIDASDTSERRIIATNYDDDSKVNTIVLDAPADGVDDLLAQLGVGNTELGL